MIYGDLSHGGGSHDISRLSHDMESNNIWMTLDRGITQNSDLCNKRLEELTLFQFYFSLDQPLAPKTSRLNAKFCVRVTFLGYIF